MTSLKSQFEAAAEASKNLPSRPDNDSLLALYALYKQSTVGDATGERPDLMDFVNRAKYDAWTKNRGMTADEAMQQYIDLVDSLK